MRQKLHRKSCDSYLLASSTVCWRPSSNSSRLPTHSSSSCSGRSEVIIIIIIISIISIIIIITPQARAVADLAPSSASTWLSSLSTWWWKETKTKIHRWQRHGRHKDKDIYLQMNRPGKNRIQKQLGQLKIHKRLWRQKDKDKTCVRGRLCEGYFSFHQTTSHFPANISLVFQRGKKLKDSWGKYKQFSFVANMNWLIMDSNQ